MFNKAVGKKQIIILRHNGGRFGNQLILYASVLAFCIEYNFECINYTFYNYRDYFDLPKGDFFTKLVNILSKFKLYDTHRDYIIVYQIYKVLTYFYAFFKKGKIIKETKDIIYLPPTKDKNLEHEKIITGIIKSRNRIFYLDGWHFRNPVGVKKHRKKILDILRPKKYLLEKVSTFMLPLKNKYYLVGVHIRQGDYKKLLRGQWYFTVDEVAKILKNFSKEYLKKKPVMFIICSDGPVDLAHFNKLNTRLGPGSLIEDFIALSMCNLIIGSNSTFGSMAAYFGNIRFIEFDRKKINK